MIASALSEVLPLAGVVIGAVLSIFAQSYLATSALRRNRREAARLFHAELSGLLLVLTVEAAEIHSERAQARYQALLNTWREHRGPLTMVDRHTWASLWVTMQSLDVAFSMNSPDREDHSLLARAVSDAAKAVSPYTGPTGARRAIRRIWLGWYRLRRRLLGRAGSAQ
jgi:hypothetical protein